VRVALEQREKATQAGTAVRIRGVTRILLALAAARAAQVIMAPPIMAVTVAPTGRTITPTAPPAVRVLERGLAVAVVPATTIHTAPVVKVVVLALVLVREALLVAAQVPTRAAAAAAHHRRLAPTETVVLAVAGQ
jgi:hypothetical protein